MAQLLALPLARPWRWRSSSRSPAGWRCSLCRDEYEAYSRVFVDQRTALKPVLQGLAVDQQDVGAELNYVRQSLLAGPEMEKIATQSGVLTASVANDKMKTQILRDMVNRIVLTVAQRQRSRGGIATRPGRSTGIGYKDGDRARALRVVQILVNTFVEETLGGKLESAATAQKFLESQLKDYEQRLRAAENRLADFKKRNVGLMPNDGASYFQQLQTEYDAVQKSKTSLDTPRSPAEPSSPSSFTAIRPLPPWRSAPPRRWWAVRRAAATRWRASPRRRLVWTNSC